jgi:hypothetical protein
MSRLLFPLLAIVIIISSCKDKKNDKYIEGFTGITPAVARTLVTAYSDPRVPHDLDHIIKSISLNSKEFGQLASRYDSIRLFTAADTITFMPTIVIQAVNSESSPATYSYYLFAEMKGTICPPPQDCNFLFVESSK